MFEKEEDAPLPTEETNAEEVVMLSSYMFIRHNLILNSKCVFTSCYLFITMSKSLWILFCSLQQGDAKTNKTKVWQNKNKGAKKAAKSKKKKLTKKKPVTQQQAKGDKAKQANGNVAGNVRIIELYMFSLTLLKKQPSVLFDIQYHSKKGPKDLFWKKLILLFSKDALNWSKVIKTFSPGFTDKA